MSGFWADGGQGWLWLFGVAVLVIGVVIGEVDGRARGVRHEVAVRREKRQAMREAAYFRGVRESALMAPPELHHEEWWDQEELVSEWHDHAPLKYGDEGVPGCPACDRHWECHEGQALALARPEAGPSWPETEGDDRDDPPPPPPPDEPGLTPQDRVLLGLDQPETEEEAIAHFAAVADEIIAWAHAAAYPGGKQ